MPAPIKKGIFGQKVIPPPKEGRPHGTPAPRCTNLNPELRMLIQYLIDEHRYSEKEAEHYCILHLQDVEKEAQEKGGIDPALFGYNSIPL